MAIYKCKMCGGELIVEEGASVAVCEYCGTKQTVPKTDNEVLTNLFNRANNLRLKCEFDKAASIYEKIVQEDDSEAEAHWGLVLCKYGIEYVEDPKTHERIPTCHRTLFDPITTDVDYQAAIDYSDTLQQSIYEQEARKIDRIQKDILAIVKEEKPFDVFLCYKETDENGKRTQDSVIANDIYYQLTQEGFKVFYAAITLEDKLGQEYEPYIFAALNSAKVMLVIGTKPEYFNAVWVKNEWSRFMSFMKTDRTKLLIPCYKDMDAYDLPEEFSHLQAQDMSKIGFINDVVRGIKKVIVKETPKETVKETVVVQQTSGGTSAETQIKRGNMALSDHEWEKADGFFEEALNLDAENAEAYLGKLLAKDKMPNFDSWVEMQRAKYADVKTERLNACEADIVHVEGKARELALAEYLDADKIRKVYDYDFGFESALSGRKDQKEKQWEVLSADKLLAHAKQYAFGDIKEQLEQGLSSIAKVLDGRIEQARKEDESSIAKVKQAYAEHLVKADRKAEEMGEDARRRREEQYQAAISRMEKARSYNNYDDSIEALKAMRGYKDCEERIEKCLQAQKNLLEERKKKAEQERKKKIRIAIAAAATVAVCIAVLLVIIKVVIPNKNYNAAVALKNKGKYDEAIEAFTAMNGYRDSDAQIESCETAIKDIAYENCLALKDAGKYDEAIEAFTAMDRYRDSDAQIESCETAIKDIAYENCLALKDAGKYDEAIEAFTAMDGYRDSDAQIESCETAIKDITYENAIELKNTGNYVEAYEAFASLNGYKDSSEKMQGIKPLYYKELPEKASVGSIVYFGAYEQDNDPTNGQEAIGWIVLEKEGNKALLISRYALEAKPYNEELEDTTWEECTMRSWLNNDFYTAAFNEEEQKYIIESTVLADRNPNYYNTGLENDTRDELFLLSIPEVNRCFSNDEERKCALTEYAKAQGGFTSSRATCWWWLRSPIRDGYYIAYVDYFGSVSVDGFYNDLDGCVRPALWISLK